jgi:mRNA interferase RelE/StbE
VKVVISKPAGRALRQSHKRKLVARKIAELAAAPEAQRANVKRLQGKPGFRLRVQDWRVLFRIENGVLYIDEIEPRGSIYEDRK